ncbi:MAG: ArsR/SmtB family transcription factor [bacterium]
MLKSADLFKILSVDTRIEIVERLKAGKKNVNRLAEELGVSPSAVSQHLRVLKSAGLVAGDRRGQSVEYSLRREALEECRQRLSRICTCGCLDAGRGSCSSAGKE